MCNKCNNVLMSLLIINCLFYQLLRPSGQVNKFELPDEFFNMSVDDIKREQRVK